MIAAPMMDFAKHSDTGGAVVAFGISLIATFTGALIAWQHAYFCGDDYLGLYGVVTQSLRDFLLTPMDVHFIPLHKLATWVIYRIAPLDFRVALGVMCAFDLLGLWMLYRALELLGASRLSAPLTALCATNAYFAVLLWWWTAGIARFPYILLSIAAIYHYLRFRRSRSWGRLAAVAACTIGACAFFSKGLLIPGFLGAIELALLPETSRRDLVRNLAAIAVAAGMVVVYRRIGSSFTSVTTESPPFDWRNQVVALEMAATILQQGIFGVLPAVPWSIANWLIATLWLAFFVASVARDRFTLVVWLLMLVTLAVNFLVITLSPRMNMGAVIVTAERYYFELMFLVVLFMAILLRRTVPDAAAMSTPRGRAIVRLIWCGVVLSSWSSWRSVHQLLDSPRYAQLRVVRTFTSNLRAGLAELRRNNAGTLDFAEGFVPRPVLGLAVMKMGQYSKFLVIFDPAIRVSSGGRCRYVVRSDGAITPPPEGCRS